MPASMSHHLKKLSTFRQLSLNCDSSSTDQRRKTLKKQFSEDEARRDPLPPSPWTHADARVGIKITLNSKTRSLINAPPIKIAWEEDTTELIKNDETVIVKKCQENCRIGKLSRQSSIEKDSILHSKQEIAERLQQQNNKEPPQPQEKPNLKIFLAHNSKEPINSEHYLEDLDSKVNEPPKIMPPLILNNNATNFQIRKSNRIKLNLAESNDAHSSPSRTRDVDRNTVVVVPIMETQEEKELANVTTSNKDTTIKPIDSVIIRPATASNAAASRRERFQKRTNSAFHQTIKESPITLQHQQTRPVLVRSSSAPVKPEPHTRSNKFLGTKRKLKTTKRPQKTPTTPLPTAANIAKQDDDSPKTQKELNRCVATNGSDVVTMVSLVSPAGSDVEEEGAAAAAVEATAGAASEHKDNRAHCKGQKVVGKEDKDVVPAKVLSLRKTVKSVTFQQSSIHAIRSFSASFPQRRASVATALMMSSTSNQRGLTLAKLQEKRGSISSIPDDDETMPKRRLVRSESQTDQGTSGKQPEEGQRDYNNTDVDDDNKQLGRNAAFSVQIKEKADDDKPEQEQIDSDKDPGKNDGAAVSNSNANDGRDAEQYDSPKEKQCWNMYCKMTEKGINVSFDTILRGMLTPTEYRISKRKIEAQAQKNDCVDGDATDKI